MAVKYFCPKCGRRFVEWGAQKLDFKCPTEKCGEEPLLVLGSQEMEAIEGPKIKRVKKSKAPLPVSAPDFDMSDMDDPYMGGDELDVDEEGEIEEEEEVEALVVEDDEVVVLDEAVVVDEDAEEGDDDAFVEALDIDADELIVDEE